VAGRRKILKFWNDFYLFTVILVLKKRQDIMGQQKFQPLHLDYTFQSSVTSVYDAWITKPVAELWLFKSETNQLNFESDLKEGGRFSVVEYDSEKKIDHRGEWLEIKRPNILHFTLEVPAHFEGISEVLIEIKETPGGTQLALTQKNIDTSKTETAWKRMLAKLDEVLTQPYLATIQSGKNEVIPAVMVTAMQVVGLARSLDEEKWNTVPYKGSWTPAQLVRHLLKSVSGIGPLIQKPSTPAERNPGERIIQLKQNFLDITKTMQSPEFIVPEKMHYNKQSLITEFEAALAPLTKLKDVNLNELITGLPLGPITKLEIVHFILYHFQRHLIQMRRITEALKTA
jgi:uncharacterized protein YndB with AHSA1/START domain